MTLVPAESIIGSCSQLSVMHKGTMPVQLPPGKSRYTEWADVLECGLNARRRVPLEEGLLLDSVLPLLEIGP